MNTKYAAKLLLLFTYLAPQIICLLALISFLLPLGYFIAFDPSDETQRFAQQLPKGIVVECCFNYASFERNGKQVVRADFRWAAPGTIGFSLKAPHFNRCGYLPWLPFMEYPETMDIINFSIGD